MARHRRLAHIFALALSAGVLFGASPARAQIAGGGITAFVFDSSEKPIPNALVVITDLARQTTRTLLTSSDGGFNAPGLTPGIYRVDISHDGFRPAAREPIGIRTGETVRLDNVILQIGGGAEAVVVVGDASRLRSTATLKQVIPQPIIEDVPLNGRNFLSLTALSAGVALPPGVAQFPRINGGRPRTNEYLFDGISVLQPEPGQVAFFPIVDAIQEFTVVNNSAPAEFGRYNGGIVNLTTRAGTNRMHGTLFEFMRDEALNARNYFQSSDPVKPEFGRHQFGGTMGGPVVSNRVFFFGDYQGQRQDVARTVFASVPTELQRQGDFTEPIGGRVVPIYDPSSLTPNGAGGFTRTQFANNRIPKEKMDPVALALLERYPHPTSAGMANNYRRTAIEGDDQNQVDGRVDATLRPGSLMFVRVSRFDGRFDPVTPLPDGSGTPFGPVVGPQKTIAWSTAGGYQRTLSPRLFNELRIGDTRRSVDRNAAPANGFVTPGIPADAEFANMLPAFTITNYTQLGSPLSTATDFSTSVTEVADSLLWSRGKHSIKGGFDFRWERVNVVQPPYPTGLFNFTSFFTDLPGVSNTGNALASFLTGQVANFQIDLQESRIRNRATINEYFIQDDWRVSDRWTISPGLRYTLNFPSTEVDNQAAVFNPETQAIEYLGRDGNPRAARTLDKANFGPRLGVAGRITDRTVVSGGYARVFIEQAGITTPFTTPAFPFIQSVQQRTLDNRTPAFVLATGPTITPVGLTPDAGLGQGVFVVNRDRQSGYVQQWNVAVQREITRQLVVEIAYVGSRITNVGMPDANLNQLTVEQLALGSTLQEKVPNPFFGEIPRSSSIGDPEITRAQLMKPFPKYLTVAGYRDNRGRTSYNGLTLRMEQRMSHGIMWIANYTRSKLIDQASSVFDASIQTGPQTVAAVADTFNPDRDRDYSNGDIPHVFTASVSWNLPAGRGRDFDPKGWLGALARDWDLAAVITAQSGVPIAVTQNNLNAFAGFLTQRPNLVGDPELPGDQRNAQHWFNAAAFQQAPVFTLGTATRNPVRGPAYQNVDLAIVRDVPLGAMTGRSVELRVEIFNLMNSVQLGAPSGTLGPALGTITTAFDPRVVQLAAKIKF